MSNQNESVGRTPVTGEPVDVTEAQARKKKAEEKIRQTVQEKMEQAGKIIRQAYGPPGTP